MSKTDKSPRLVGILRFDAPSSSTRTLNATQAYDMSRSQIVLGSFTGKLTDKTATEKDEADNLWGVGLTTDGFGGPVEVGPIDVGGAKRNVDGTAVEARTVTLSAVGSGEVKSQKVTIPCKPCCPCNPNGLTYSGVTREQLPDMTSSSNSKATNANTTYYGAITVGLGEYKK